MRVRLIGVDWSAVEANRGIAIVGYDEGFATVELAACKARRSALQLLSEALADTSRPTVIAIDSPLGWPISLSLALAHHSAGDGLDASADAMFSRDTDRFVQQSLRKRPLEVGANLIARTAHSANQFLGELRRRTGRPIPLLWSHEDIRGAGVIEVYPAATKIVAGADNAAVLLGAPTVDVSSANAHVKDALWCAVAALHFARGECHAPEDLVKSQREGWIWFKRGIS